MFTIAQTIFGRGGPLRDMTPRPKDERRHELATQASQEMDEDKLVVLVQQLCNALDERHRTPPAAQTPE